MAPTDRDGCLLAANGRPKCCHERLVGYWWPTTGQRQDDVVGTIGSVRYVLNQFLDRAAEVRAKAIKDVGACAVAFVVEDFRQRHAVHACGLRHFLYGDAARLLELLFLDLLSELKTDHEMPLDNI